MNDYFRQLQTALATLDDGQLASLHALAWRTIERDGTIWLAGNGGSASVAQHWACDLSKAAGVRAQSLGVNSALLTAWANDDTYAGALAEELKQLARLDDCLICLSCSGTSPNIARVLRQAWLMKLPQALLTRAGGVHIEPLSVLVEIGSDDYKVAEDCFAAIGHWLTRELETCN